MQQSDIVKLCADSLRNHRYFQPPSVSKLKSSHAHELVAAFFGYNSKNAMLADKKYPVSNLPQADFLVTHNWNSDLANIIRQRLKELDVPEVDCYDVSFTIRDTLNEQGVTCFDQSLRELAIVFSKRKLVERFKKLGIDIDQLNLNVEVLSSDVGSSNVSFTISSDYLSDEGKTTLRDSTMTVIFPRVVGRVGYKEPEIQETLYTGEARRVPHRERSHPQWPYPVGTLVMRRDSKEVGIVLRTELGDDHSREGGVTLIQDTSLEASLVKSEVFPLADQKITFVPLRLFIPYGKYICVDGSEVLYNRDYRPLWKRASDGKVTRIDSDLYIDHVKAEGFFNGSGLPDWDEPDEIRKIGLKILKTWGVENERPQLLDLLPQALEVGNADILKAHRYREKEEAPQKNKPADFQKAYAKKAIEFWTTRPYALHTAEQFAKRPYSVEAQFMHKTSESLKDVCFDLTQKLHDYDNDVEVRTGQDLTHRVLYLCTTPQEAEEMARLLSANPNIRVHKLY